jgi:hypothetical protein
LTIIPIKPFPRGKASSKYFAGLSNQIVSFGGSLLVQQVRIVNKLSAKN